MPINQLAIRAHQAATRQGHFINDGQGITGHLAMIHTDIALAESAVRNRLPNLYGPGRATGPQAHIADAAIRIMAIAVQHNLDLQKAVQLRIYPKGNPCQLTPAAAAAELHSEEMGPIDAATFAELCWDGHQILAQAGRDFSQHIFHLESFGMTLPELPERDRRPPAATPGKTLYLVPHHGLPRLTKPRG